jgi:hypothetical protein
MVVDAGIKARSAWILTGDGSDSSLTAASINKRPQADLNFTRFAWHCDAWSYGSRWRLTHIEIYAI